MLVFFFIFLCLKPCDFDKNAPLRGFLIFLVQNLVIFIRMHFFRLFFFGFSFGWGFCLFWMFQTDFSTGSKHDDIFSGDFQSLITGILLSGSKMIVIGKQRWNPPIFFVPSKFSQACSDLYFLQIAILDTHTCPDSLKCVYIFIFFKIQI